MLKALGAYFCNGIRWPMEPRRHELGDGAFALCPDGGPPAGFATVYTLPLMGSRDVDVGAVTERWRARGFSCATWRDPPGQVWADFVHGEDELVMVVDGDVTFELGTHNHALAPGEELLIPAGCRHTVRTTFRGASCWLYGYRTLPMGSTP